MKPHPLLNLNLSHHLVVEPIINMDNITLEPDWETLLLAMFQVTCGWDAQTLVENAAHLTRHIGPLSTFTYKEDLIDYLKIIFARLSNHLSHDFPPVIDIERANIILPIAEGIGLCTVGFYNRIIVTVSHLKSPQTIAALLMRARIHLVAQASRQVSSDIHVNTRAMTIANAMGFGVPLINADDPYAQNEPMNRRLGEIMHGTIVQFRPFSLIEALVLEIKKALALNGYEGEKRALDAMHTGYGYSILQYQTFLDYLSLILKDTSNLLILDDKDEVIDLDWVQISFVIWNHLIEHSYLTHPAGWMEPFYLSEQLFVPEQLLMLFSNPIDFFQLLQLFPQLSMEKTTALSRCYIDVYFEKQTQNRTGAMAMFLMKIAHLYGLRSGPQPTIDALFQVIKEHYLNDCIFFLQSLDRRKKALLSASPHLVKVFVEMLPYLPQDLEQSILHQSYFGLANAITRVSSERFIELLDIVSQLKPLQQVTIFTETALNGNNLLMLAIKENRFVVTRRIIELLMEVDRHDVNENLTEPFFYRIFSNKNANGEHLMALAVIACSAHRDEREVVLAEHGPILRCLIERLAGFTSTQKKMILTLQEHENQRNLLMMLITDSELWVRLLDIIADCNPEEISTILLQIDTDGYNILMLAISDTPILAPYLLNWMQKVRVPKDIIYRLMRQKEYNADADFLDETALMMVITQQPSLMPHLLVSMSHIHSAHLSILLQQTNRNNGNIVMMVVANESPLLLSQLLQFITDMRLDMRVICGLLSERNREGKTAYMMACSMMPSMAHDQLVQLIHQYALNVILRIMFNKSAEFNAGTVQRHELFDRLIDELMQCVMGNDTAALKEKFKQYAVMAVEITTLPSPLFFSHLGARNRAPENINHTPLMALDFFADESLVCAVTGGYANSSMLLAELTEASEHENECVSPLKKVRRNIE